MDKTGALGLQRALRALGFDSGLSGEIDAQTKLALADFQENLGLQASGQPDVPTLDAIERLRHAWAEKDIRRL